MSAVISDRFMNASEVAKILGVSKRTVERMEKSGALPAKTRLSHKTVGWWSSKFQAFISAT